MPKLFECNGYKFFFFSNEGIPIEPCHIHVRKGGNLCKFFVTPDVILASTWGMSSKELHILEKKVKENKDLIMRKWDEYFGK